MGGTGGAYKLKQSIRKTQTVQTKPHIPCQRPVIQHSLPGPANLWWGDVLYWCVCVCKEILHVVYSAGLNGDGRVFTWCGSLG